MRRLRDFGWQDWLRIGAGLVMLILGLIGLVLPILQGILFLLIAAVLLAPYSRRIQRWLDWSKTRFPAAHRQYRRLQARLRLFKRRLKQ